jgi:hypothetical protein
MKNTCLKIEQLSKKYYLVIKDFSVIKECSGKRLQHRLNLKGEKNKSEISGDIYGIDEYV